MTFKARFKILIQRLTLGRVIYKTSQPGQMLLSFDDSIGWDPENLVKTLHRNNVKATFFLTGRYIENNREVVRMAASHGHFIANHSYDHDRFTGIRLLKQLYSLLRTQKLICEVTGDCPKVFRPPYGDVSAPFALVCLLSGFRIVMWSLGGNEFDGKTGTTDDIIRNITSHRSPAGNDILILHPESERSHRAAIDIVEKNLLGSKFIPLEELLAQWG